MLLAFAHSCPQDGWVTGWGVWLRIASDFTGGCPPPHLTLSVKELTYSSTLSLFLYSGSSIWFNYMKNFHLFSLEQNWITYVIMELNWIIRMWERNTKGDKQRDRESYLHCITPENVIEISKAILILIWSMNLIFPLYGTY